MSRNRWSRADVIGGLIVFLVVAAVAVPVVTVVARSFGSTAGLDTLGGSAWSRILGSTRTWRVIAWTIAQAAASTLVTTVIGVPLAHVLARFAFPGRTIITTLVTVPFVLPSVVIGAAFNALVSSRGIFDARGSWALIIAAHLCFNLAVITRTVGAAFRRLDGDAEAAARILGRSRSSTFFSVLLPGVVPSIVAGSVIVFLFCLTSFGVIVILGGGSVTTMEVEIWTRATRQFDLSGAAVLSAVQVIAVMAVLVGDVVVGRRIGSVADRRARRLSTPSGFGEWASVLGAVVTVSVVCGFPLAALVFRSFQVPGGLGPENWERMGSVLEGTELAVSPMGAVGNSLLFAAIATVVSLVLALPASRFIARRPGRVTQSVILIPLGVSATTIGLGLLIAFGRPPLDLRGSGWLIPLAQVLVALPLVTRILVVPTREFDQSVLEAAAILGATAKQRFWRVEVPMMVPAVVAATGLGFVACLGEFGATVFVTRSNRITMPVLLERLMSRPGGAGYGQAMALAVLMVIVCAAVLALADRIGGNDHGDQLVV